MADRNGLPHRVKIGKSAIGIWSYWSLAISRGAASSRLSMAPGTASVSERPEWRTICPACADRGAGKWVASLGPLTNATPRQGHPSSPCFPSAFISVHQRPITRASPGQPAPPKAPRSFPKSAAYEQLLGKDQSNGYCLTALRRLILRVAHRIQVALPAFRTARLAQRASVQDQLVRKQNPLLLGNNLHQILFNFHRVGVLR